MALTADFHSWRMVPGTGELSLQGSVTGADTFYKGALLNITPATGTVEVANADADQFWGINEAQLVAAGAAELVTGWVRGVYWVTGVAGLTTVVTGLTVAATAASDDPADIVISAGGTVGAMGTLLHVEVSGASGYIDLTQRSLIINA